MVRFSSTHVSLISCLRVFRHQARQTLSETYPNLVWLAESTRSKYIERYRAKNELVNTDSTLYEVFDICYDYDIYGAWRATVADKLPIKSYMELVRLQSAIYPEDFIKLRFIENHDQERASYIFKNNRYKLLAWTGNLTDFNKLFQWKNFFSIFCLSLF